MQVAFFRLQHYVFQYGELDASVLSAGWRRDGVEMVSIKKDYCITLMKLYYSIL